MSAKYCFHQLIHLNYLPNAQVPVIEVCPSSNMATLGISNLEKHPWLSFWIRNKYPFSVCTGTRYSDTVDICDDVIVFVQLYSR